MDINKEIANNWRKLSGDSQWQNMLDPPSPVLRTYINHYGEMAQATYDAYIKSKNSKNAGNYRYARKNLFSAVGIVQGRPLNQYKITKYLYATSAVVVPGAFITSSSPHAWSKKSNWIGFVAVATDDGKKVLGRRDILVAWRGTINPSDFIHDAELTLVSAPIIFGPLPKDNPKVHQGWYSIYTSSDPETRYNINSAREQALDEVKRLVNAYRLEEMSLSITGHSMGGAVATLNGLDIVINGLNKQLPTTACPVTIFAFACPHVGDFNFEKVFSSQKDLYCLRIHNLLDVVPKYPTLGYADVGMELMIDTMKSDYLKAPGDPTIWHNMECYLHGVAGIQGVIIGGFKLEIKRDLTLVNKYADVLKDEYGVPSNWWCEKHNGMTQNKDGTWELNDHEEDTDP